MPKFSIGQEVEAEKFSQTGDIWFRGVIVATDHRDPLYARTGPLYLVQFHNHMPNRPLPRATDEIREISIRGESS